ncbi:MAG TPA: DUF1707 domain-containing protein [Acidimicrobiales bacterium]|jgi:hypothetical protein
MAPPEDQPNSAPVPSPQAPRASDHDRDRTIVALNDAAASGRLSVDDHLTRLDHALVAVTMPELAGLVNDLPLARDDYGLPVAIRADRVDGRFGKVVRQVAPGTSAEVHAVARFGEVVLDLRTLPAGAPPVLITADAWFGQVKILLPSGARLADTGTARFGSRKVTGDPDPSGEGPMIYLQGRCRFGQVKCIPFSARGAWGQRDR